MVKGVGSGSNLLDLEAINIINEKYAHPKSIKHYAYIYSDFGSITLENLSKRLHQAPQLPPIIINTFLPDVFALAIASAMSLVESAFSL